MLFAAFSAACIWEVQFPSTRHLIHITTIQVKFYFRFFSNFSETVAPLRKKNGSTAEDVLSRFLEYMHALNNAIFQRVPYLQAIAFRCQSIKKSSPNGEPPGWNRVKAAQYQPILSRNLCSYALEVH